MNLETAEAWGLGAMGLAKGVWQHEPALAMWGATLGAAGLYDAWAVSTKHETMSHAFHRGMEHPMYRFLCAGALGVLAVHLAHGLKDAAP